MVVAVRRRRSAEIDRYFAEMQSQRSHLWNGRVLLLDRYAIADGVLRGACFETDYASFMAWRDWEFPDPCVYNFFAAAVLRAADGGYLVGEMASSTAGAGTDIFRAGRRIRTNRRRRRARCRTQPAAGTNGGDRP